MSLEKFDIHQLPDGFFAPFDLKWLKKYYALNIESVTDYTFYYNFDGSYHITFSNEKDAIAFYTNVASKDNTLPINPFNQTPKNLPVTYEISHNKIIFQFAYRETLLQQASLQKDVDLETNVKNVNPFNQKFFSDYLGLVLDHIDKCTNENLDFKIKFKEEKYIIEYYEHISKLGLSPSAHITNKVMCFDKWKYNLLLFKLALNSKRVLPRESIFKSKLPSFEKIRVDSENNTISEKYEIDVAWFLEQCKVNKKDLEEISTGTFLWVIFKPGKVDEADKLKELLTLHEMDYLLNNKTEFRIYKSSENFAKLNREISCTYFYN